MSTGFSEGNELGNFDVSAVDWRERPSTAVGRAAAEAMAAEKFGAVEEARKENLGPKARERSREEGADREYSRGLQGEMQDWGGKEKAVEKCRAPLKRKRPISEGISSFVLSRCFCYSWSCDTYALALVSA